MSLPHRSIATCAALACIALSPLTTIQAARADDICGAVSSVVSRPTVTNAACTVNRNHLLIETGYTNVSPQTGGSTVSYPQALVRIGTSVRHLEVQFNPPSITRTSSQRGTSDSGAGIKYMFHESAKYLLSAQVNATIPTGEAFASAGNSQTIYAVNGAYTLSPVFSIASTQAFTAAAANGVRYGTYAPTLMVNAALPKIASAAFVEYSLQTHATGAGTPSRSQYFVGVSHDLGQHIQLDVETFMSPSSSVGKYRGVGFGASYLF